MNVSASNSPPGADISPKDTKDSLVTEDEQDEEVRLAMEMAMAAAKNPNLTPDQLRKLVGAEENQQAKIVAEKQQKQLMRQKEEARQRWEHQKQSAVQWWKGAVQDVQEAAAVKAQELKDQAERRRHYDTIKKDSEYQELRKAYKNKKKTLKAHRLQGNRVETRHAFKRQRMERHLMNTSDKLHKMQSLLTGTSFNAQEYAKAMLRASKKWNKNATDEELSLEAQLCRNMHQMLSIEKQKSKVKKETRDVRKYLQRCKGWLDDKRALCEMNLLTLDATSNSIMTLYVDTIKRQDELIAKLREKEEFSAVDLDDVDVSQFDLPPKSGPGATLNALRGLPFRDSILVAQDHQKQQAKTIPPVSNSIESQNSTVAPNGNRPELFIETTEDNNSVSSHLSDPDSPDGAESFGKPADSGDENGIAFGKDAPWAVVASDAGSQYSSEETSPEEPKSKKTEQKPDVVSIGSSTPETSSNSAPAEDAELPAEEEPASDDPPPAKDGEVAPDEPASSDPPPAEDVQLSVEESPSNGGDVPTDKLSEKEILEEEVAPLRRVAARGTSFSDSKSIDSLRVSEHSLDSRSVRRDDSINDSSMLVGGAIPTNSMYMSADVSESLLPEEVESSEEESGSESSDEGPLPLS